MKWSIQFQMDTYCRSSLLSGLAWSSSPANLFALPLLLQINDNKKYKTNPLVKSEFNRKQADGRRW